MNKCTLFCLIIISMMIMPFAQASDFQLAPLSESFMEYQNQSEKGFGSDYKNYGYVPSPLNLSNLTGPEPLVIAQDSFPEKFDLRDTGYVTSVKDQGPCNSGWAFAILGAAESEILASSGGVEKWDFSENNLKNTHGFDYDPCDGGNVDMATAYLARYSGPVNEIDDPYSPSPLPPSPENLPVQKHLQEMYRIPSKASPLDNNYLKYALQHYGAVYTTYHHDDSCLKDSYYYYSGYGWWPNHAVILVGWDDTIPPDQFTTTPPGPGAWLVKNSWGNDFGSDGFFWVSYYDTNMGYGENSVFPKMEEPLNYDHQYEHDYLGHIGSIWSGGSFWGANVFTATSDETLSAVSFYTEMMNTDYQIAVFLNKDEPPVDMDSAIYTSSGRIEWPGYHTIPVAPVLSLSKGEPFVVAVRLKSPGYWSTLPIEYAIPGYSSKALVGEKESYIHWEWTDNWYDISKEWEYNLCIKAFTTSGMSAQFSALNSRGKAPLEVQFLDSSPGNPVAWRWDFGDGSAINEQGPNHTYQNPGVYNVSLEIFDSSGSMYKTSKVGYITALTDTVKAKLGYEYADVTNNRKIQFIDKSEGVGINQWFWEFGDGYISEEQNPIHEYAVPDKNEGTVKYGVSLRVSNGIAEDTTLYPLGIV